MRGSYIEIKIEESRTLLVAKQLLDAAERRGEVVKNQLKG